MDFNTLHIFNFGKIQLINEDYNKIVNSSELTNLQNFIDYIVNQKPNDFDLENFHVLHVFNNTKAKYIVTTDSFDVSEYTVDWSNLDLNLLQSLVDEILAIEE